MAGQRVQNAAVVGRLHTGPMKRPRAASLILVAAIGIGVIAPGASSGADPVLVGVSAMALADGGRVTFTVPRYAVVEQIIDGGAATAQAVLESFSATSFASLPYPGDTAVAGPGTLSGLTGLPNPGSYPLYASASHPTVPYQEVKDPSGSYRLEAKAEPSLAEGSAQLRGGGGQGSNGGSGGTRSFAQAEQQADEVTAVAETLNEALSFGNGALRVASVRSRSQTTFNAAQGTPATKTNLVVEGGSAGGYSFAYGPDGLVMASQGVPIPAGIGLQQLNQALSPAGISFRIGEAQSLVGGASAEALEILMREPSPAPGVPGAVIQFRFGAATTAISVGGVAPPAGDAPPAGAMPDDATAVPVSKATPPVSEQTAVPPPHSVDHVGGIAPQGGRAVDGLTIAAEGEHTPDGLSMAPEGEPASDGSIQAEPRRASGDTRVATAQPILQRHGDGDEGANFVYGMIFVTGVLLVGVAGLWRRKGLLRV